MSLRTFLCVLCAAGFVPGSVACAQTPGAPRHPSGTVAPADGLALDTLHANYLRRREQPCVDAVDPGCRLYNVSIAELLVHPGLFHGKHVRVIGFLHLEFEGTAVYLTREDHQHGLVRNGLWVDFLNPTVSKRADALNDRYVLIEGTLDAENRGHMGLWSGAIRDIYRVQAWH